MARVYWRDLEDDRRGGAWLGLLLAASASKGSSRPSLRMEAGGRRMLRLTAGGTPLLWARVEGGYYGYWYLRDDETRALAVLPPLRFDDARHVSKTHARGTDAWYRAWASSFAEGLRDSERSPLDGTDTLLAPVDVSLRATRLRPRSAGRLRVPPILALGEILSVSRHGFTRWEVSSELPVLPLRTLANDTSDRVKAYRRLAREGLLPPVLLMWASGLQRYLLLDGHDRLVAALLEGMTPDCLAILSLTKMSNPHDRYREGVVKAVEQLMDRSAAPLSECSQRDAWRARAVLRGRSVVDVANGLLIDAFDDRPWLFARSRAWPLDGGESRWTAEVKEALGRVPDPERGMLP